MLATEFLKVFTYLFAATDTYGKDFGATQMVYSTEFEKCRLNEFREAVSVWLKTKSKFPSVSELRELIPSINKSQLHCDIAEAIVWKAALSGVNAETFIDGLDDFCGFKITESDKAVIKLSVKLFGGFQKIRDSSEESSEFLRRRFREIYNNRVSESKTQQILIEAREETAPILLKIGSK